MEKKPLIIRCSDGWIYGLFGYYEEAVEVAEQHVDGTEHTYIITATTTDGWKTCTFSAGAE